VVIGSGAGLMAIGHGLVPHFAPHGVARQAIHLLDQLVWRARFKDLDNAGVQSAPPLQ
jgi:hypothetical protein